MKGDVGMSLHEKERNKKMPTPIHKVTHNPIPIYIFVSSRSQHAGNWIPRCCALPRAFIANKQHVKDVGMGL